MHGIRILSQLSTHLSKYKDERLVLFNVTLGEQHPPQPWFQPWGGTASTLARSSRNVPFSTECIINWSACLSRRSSHQQPTSEGTITQAKYTIPKATIDTYKFAVFPRTVRIWNRLPGSVVHVCTANPATFREAALPPHQHDAASCYKRDPHMFLLAPAYSRGVATGALGGTTFFSLCFLLVTFFSAGE